jgi:hypothetical protein
MALASERTRRKATTAATRLLEPGTTIRAVGFGRANARWTTAGIVMLSVFASGLGIGLLLGFLFFPGIIGLLLFREVTCPQRVVVVADQGVAVLHRSALDGRPKRVLCRLPFAALTTPAGPDEKRRLGYDLVQFKGKELQQLLAAVPQPAVNFS